MTPTILSGVDLYKLAHDAHYLAEGIVSTVGPAMKEESTAKLAEGYLVAAPEAIDTALHYFAAIAKAPGWGSALRADIRLDNRLDLIMGFGSGLRDFEEWIDIAWSSTWQAWRRQSEHAKVAAGAIAVLNAWNAGHRDAVMAQMKRDAEAAYHDEVWRR